MNFGAVTITSLEGLSSLPSAEARGALKRWIRLYSRRLIVILQQAGNSGLWTAIRLQAPWCERPWRVFVSQIELRLPLARVSAFSIPSFHIEKLVEYACDTLTAAGLAEHCGLQVKENWVIRCEIWAQTNQEGCHHL